MGRHREHRQSRGGSEAEPDAREWDRDLQGQTEEEEQSARRKLACGLCGAMLNPEDVSFGLTKKMVRETLFHVSEQASERTKTNPTKHARVLNGCVRAEVSRCLLDSVWRSAEVL